jgi:hypothetical protein
MKIMVRRIDASIPCSGPGCPVCKAFEDKINSPKRDFDPTPMNWKREMVRAYVVGVEDGLNGFRRGRPNDFEGCYEQGWQHGKKKRLDLQLRAYARAHELMQAQLVDILEDRGGE